LLQELPSQERRESSEPLLGRSLTTSTTYGGFSEETDPHYLGVAKAGAGPLNRLFFLWVNQLIRKLQGCGFNRVSGSGSGSRRAKMTRKSRNFFKSSCFEVCWMASFES
jgi:hypothetical protein